MPERRANARNKREDAGNGVAYAKALFRCAALPLSQRLLVISGSTRTSRVANVGNRHKGADRVGRFPFEWTVATWRPVAREALDTHRGTVTSTRLATGV